MTLQEAILKSLADIDEPINYSTVYKRIIDKGYFNFGETKTPKGSVSTILGNFIRTGDIRVKRMKQDDGTYSYYLAQNEENIIINSDSDVKAISKLDKNYKERDLHKLLSSYLKNTSNYSKTIFHEKSNGKDKSQIWTHPDMIGVKFLNLASKTNQAFLRYFKSMDTVKLSSYEIKREINTDSELKQAYFQAVSNSSWANFGYLVAFEFSDNLLDEIERLNQSFGIGIIELNANPYQSKIIFPAKYKELDFKTIDKVCKNNQDFEMFIEQIEKLLTANIRYYKSTEKELTEFCDSYFENDTEVERYCREKHIPIEEE